MSILASAPGSIMISGEHAVVYGYPAIVAAIEQRITVTLCPRTDHHIEIHSALGDYRAPADQLHDDPRLRFVLASLERYPHHGGLDIHITSKINPTLGLGSSAAITVAMLGALARHTGEDESLPVLHEQALQIIRHLQGRGSGADLAASLYGGMIAYRNLPQVTVSRLPLAPVSLYLQNSGYKTPTAEVLACIAAKMQENPAFYQQLYRQMGETANAAIHAANADDWSGFYAALNQYQAHMAELGVSDDTLTAMIAAARAQPETFASKISGSGLGDCIVTFARSLPPDHQPVTLATQGLILSHD